jgi:DNA-binding PadR family transcriptional regulator
MSAAPVYLEYIGSREAAQCIFTDGIHMTCLDAKYLHRVAAEIGLNRNRFHGLRKGHPHYDLTPAGRRELGRRDHVAVSSRIVLAVAQKLAENIKTHFEFMTLNDVKILSALLSGDKYGLEIITTVNRKSGLTFTKLATGSLYNALARLERDGLIEGRTRQAPAGGNNRTYYSLTPAGVQKVKDIQSALNKLWSHALPH